MPWYSTEHVDDISILRLKGDASTRSFQWLGGLDGLLMRGHRQLVISRSKLSSPMLRTRASWSLSHNASRTSEAPWSS